MEALQKSLLTLRTGDASVLTNVSADSAASIISSSSQILETSLSLLGSVEDLSAPDEEWLQLVAQSKAAHQPPSADGSEASQDSSEIQAADDEDDVLSIQEAGEELKEELAEDAAATIA